MHGQYIWYELTTPDVDAAKKFYPRFTGWGTQPFDKDYTMWTTGGVPLAGLFRLTDEMAQQGVPPNWMPYVEANNVDETAAKAVSLGGKVMHGPDDIPGAGRFAVVQDPQGAVFGVYKSTNPSGAWDGTPVIGRFSWHELMTTDYVAAFEFYRALFGWEKTGEMDMGGGQNYLMYGKGDQMYGGMYNVTADMAGMHPFWLLYINVPDVGKAVTTATKAGATIHRPQMDIPGGSIAILGDPQGAGFAVHHVNAPADSKPASKAPAKPAAKKSVRKAVKKAGKKVATAAKKAARRVSTAAKKVAKKVSNAAKRGRKTVAKKSPRKATKTATRFRAKSKATRKAAPKSRPNAKKKKTAAGRRR